MNKKIITIVSVALALVFVALLLILFSNIQSMGSNATNELGNASATLGRYELTRFDNKVISGKELKDAIENFRETSKGEKLSYCVWAYNNNSNEHARIYGYDTVELATSVYNVSVLSSPGYTYYILYSDKGYNERHRYYIDDEDTYTCSLVMKNGVVYGIKAINTYKIS